MPTVLLVVSSKDKREELGARLEARGIDVMICGGPRAPTYECLATRDEHCPLAAACDTVVLDCDLDSDAAMRGTPSWLLAEYYTRLGLPVVALTTRDQAKSATFARPGVHVVDDAILVADRVEAVIAGRSKG